EEARSLVRRPDEDSRRERLRLALHHGGQEVAEDAVRLRGVVRDVRPGGRHGVPEPRGIPVSSLELLRDARASLPEDLRRGVVGRGDPAIRKARCPAQAGVRAPRADPDGRAAGAGYVWLDVLAVRGVELAVPALASPERPDDLDGFVEAGPPLLP